MSQSVEPGSPPAGWSRQLAWRRRVFLALVACTLAGLVTLLAFALGSNGLTASDWGMLLCFALGAPWVVIGFYNALAGFLIRTFSRDPLATVLPLARPGDGATPSGRTALVMPAYNEQPERVFRHLQALWQTLKATGKADAFEIFLLSDTDDPAIAAEEARRFAAWQATEALPARLHYRRRTDNAGHKVGNIHAFLEADGARFDYMVVLDADSVMSGTAVVRLATLMDANPDLGILQHLTVGLPTLSPFARVFQFGMRHGMRSYATGAAWWQGDEGPYWGHNAILRVAPFMAHCRLPVLPGRPPLGGAILSHDQVEAVLMRRAGYAVRVLPEEDGSFEENPPNLAAYAVRDLRWCNGNMQYWRLLGMPGIRALGRLQLALAILMYLGSPLWLGFLALGFSQAAGLTAHAVGEAATAGLVHVWFGLALFLAMMTMSLSPVLFGVAEVLASRRRRQENGGGGAVVGGTAVQIVFSVFQGPIMAVAHTIFMAGLLAGKKIRWQAQDRDSHAVSWREALRGLWPQLLLGLVWTVGLAVTLPAVLPWAAPVLLGLIGAVPFAVVTASPALGRWLARNGICTLPEERRTPPEVRLAGLDPMLLDDRPGAGLAPDGALAAPGPSPGAGPGAHRQAAADRP